MMPTQVETGIRGGSPRRRVKGRTGSSGKISTRIIMNEKQLKHSPLEQGVDDGSPVSVTFWMPDGSCDEGKARHVDRNVMFIESKRTLPVGTEVT